jgi:ABC-type Zn2+ transport system substrate-binding protein/surface adhesin
LTGNAAKKQNDDDDDDDNDDDDDEDEDDDDEDEDDDDEDEDDDNYDWGRGFGSIRQMTLNFPVCTQVIRRRPSARPRWRRRRSGRAWSTISSRPLSRSSRLGRTR